MAILTVKLIRSLVFPTPHLKSHWIFIKVHAHCCAHNNDKQIFFIYDVKIQKLDNGSFLLEEKKHK